MQWFFARRYLFSRSSHSVINIIAGVSLVSVAIPVAAMIILLSVFNGFESLIKRMYATTDADIEISRIENPTSTLRHQILETEGVAAASFVIEGEALVRYEKRETAALVRGVDEHYFDVLPIDRNLIQGSAESHKALITKDVAQLLAMYTSAGSNISLHTIAGSKVGSMLPVRGIRSEQIAIGGIIRSSQQIKGMIITPLATTEGLFGAEKTKIYVRCLGSGESVKKVLQKILPEGTKITTREEKNAAFYQIMRYEKWAVFFVALLVLLIASLSIIGTVIMLIVEKRDQQQTLLSMGADKSFIRGIFVREGLLISGIGGAVGLIIGIVVVLIQQHFGIITLPSASFIVEAYPVQLQATDICAVFITFVAIAWSVSQIAANTMIKR
ncbi:MAG: ABC transporter permease [Alistipes sp.]|nr:ABC transporter permease [Alistipes sp.]